MPCGGQTSPRVRIPPSPLSPRKILHFWQFCGSGFTCAFSPTFTSAPARLTRLQRLPIPERRSWHRIRSSFRTAHLIRSWVSGNVYDFGVGLDDLAALDARLSRFFGRELMGRTPG